jgi:hypothetical protein
MALTKSFAGSETERAKWSHCKNSGLGSMVDTTGGSADEARQLTLCKGRTSASRPHPWTFQYNPERPRVQRQI